MSSRVNSLHIAEFYEQVIPVHATGDLLDLGCGNVSLFGMYKPFVRNITCVDWPNTSHSFLHVDIFADLNEDLPLEN